MINRLYPDAVLRSISQRNINVDLLKQRFRPEVETLVELFGQAIVFVIFLLITVSSAGRTWEAYQRGWRTIGVIEFPQYVSWLLVTAGLTTLCMRLLLQMGATSRR